MAVLLNVPFVTQLSIGGHVPGSTGPNDPTGCWYASACMGAYYFEKGPRYGVPELFKQVLSGGLMGHFATGSDEANLALANHHDVLAKRERLQAVPKCETSYSYTADNLEELLRQQGPIFFYWRKWHSGSQYGHASVIIGVDGGRIVYHDPENLPNSRMHISHFNTARQRWKYALMQRNSDGQVKARR